MLAATKNSLFSPFPIFASVNWQFVSKFQLSKKKQDFLKCHFSQIRFRKKGTKEKQANDIPTGLEREIYVCRISCFFMTEVPVWCLTERMLWQWWQVAAMQTARVRDFVWIWNRGLAFCCWWFVGSCHLTWGHSWVVFDQHPMLQKGSSESEAGHLPWLSCWWLYRCSPASRVLSFPSSYFRCARTQASSSRFETVEELWWGDQGGKRSQQSKVAAHQPSIEKSQWERFTRTHKVIETQLLEKNKNKKNKSCCFHYRRLSTPKSNFLSLSSSFNSNQIHTYWGAMSVCVGAPKWHDQLRRASSASSGGWLIPPMPWTLQRRSLRSCAKSLWAVAQHHTQSKCDPSWFVSTSLYLFLRLQRCTQSFAERRSIILKIRRKTQFSREKK